MTVDRIAGKIRTGGRLSSDEALLLYRQAPTSLLGRLADEVRARKHPDGIVTYIIDRNVNYTNVCVAKCNFCAFYREVGASDGYVLGFDEIFRKIDETIDVGGVQLLLQGGHNPDLPLAWYEDLFRAIKQRYPSFKLHALSPPEVIHLSRLSQLPVPQVVERLIACRRASGSGSPDGSSMNRNEMRLPLPDVSSTVRTSAGTITFSGLGSSRKRCSAPAQAASTTSFGDTPNARRIVRTSSRLRVTRV